MGYQYYLSIWKPRHCGICCCSATQVSARASQAWQGAESSYGIRDAWSGETSPGREDTGQNQSHPAHNAHVYQEQYRSEYRRVSRRNINHGIS